VVQFAALLELELLSGHVLGHSREEGVDKRVRITFTTLTGEATMIEATGDEHLPDSRVTPVVGNTLGPDADIEIVVAPLQGRWNSPVFVPVQAHHVLLKLLEGLVKSLLVVLAFTLAEGDETAFIPNENENTPMVHTV